MNERQIFYSNFKLNDILCLILFKLINIHNSHYTCKTIIKYISLIEKQILDKKIQFIL